MGEVFNRDLQFVELEILNEFVRICDLHGIEYFLDFGTLLGAIRHKGFIPWDDDIDVGMTRENYDNFIKIAKKELKQEFFLQDGDSDPRCPYLFAKIRKNNTTFMEWCNRKSNIHHGIYIDIFPYDKLPINKRERSNFRKKCQRRYKLFHYRASPDRYVAPRKTISWLVVAVVRRLINYFLRILPLKFYRNLAISTFTKHNDESSNFIGAVPFFNEVDFTKDVFFPLEQGEFEGETYYIPRDSNYYLTSIYGDYMQLPPPEKRQGHTPYKVSLSSTLDASE